MDENEESMWPIVRRVTGPDEEARRKKVEDPRTRLCIMGGMLQLERAFHKPLIGIGGQGRGSSNLPDCRIRSMLAFNQVVEAINKKWSPDKEFTRKTFETRWEIAHDYIADLLSYALYRKHWALHEARNPEVLEQLKTDENIARAIRKVAYLNQQQALASDLHRLQGVLTAFADADEGIQRALGETRALVEKLWSEVYAEVFEARGVQLRHDLPLQTFTRILHCADLGTTMCMWMGEDEEDDEQVPKSPTYSLLGDIACLLVAGCLDPHDGSTIDSAVNNRFKKE
ncbi:hypothetical protein DB35_24070 [Streptomyces abyssalis]|uniref:Uncharacterized protein n=1 Tax=Streptomyces abyssalis TaxID=933944 RepID=A0A1E7JNM7_9ACTN|nr:hypothetical protein [Streptomyces abyssalis]OEU86732.1 hypothetical protein DB35_24070 [Streptomyces abyssalis]OEU89881.1 hypothetical protein AN215_09470 [Streptomyces abyssalis]OEV06495.1 hypothetical protein AN219_34445 [Streptomyces nanshensis]